VRYSCDVRESPKLFVRHVLHEHYTTPFTNASRYFSGCTNGPRRAHDKPHDCIAMASTVTNQALHGPFGRYYACCYHAYVTQRHMYEPAADYTAALPTLVKGLTGYHHQDSVQGPTQLMPYIAIKQQCTVSSYQHQHQQPAHADRTTGPDFAPRGLKEFELVL
jgi:hypothetical protein